MAKKPGKPKMVNITKDSVKKKPGKPPKPPVDPTVPTGPVGTAPIKPPLPNQPTTVTVTIIGLDDKETVCDLKSGYSFENNLLVCQLADGRAMRVKCKEVVESNG